MYIYSFVKHLYWKFSKQSNQLVAHFIISLQNKISISPNSLFICIIIKKNTWQQTTTSRLGLVPKSNTQVRKRQYRKTQISPNNRWRHELKTGKASIKFNKDEAKRSPRKKKPPSCVYKFKRQEREDRKSATPEKTWKNDENSTRVWRRTWDEYDRIRLIVAV